MDKTNHRTYLNTTSVIVVALLASGVLDLSRAIFSPTSPTYSSTTITTSEHFQYKNPTLYSYATILEQPLASSLARCASACQRNPACDGFYYSLYHPISCYLGATFIKRQTTYVDPAAYRLYLRTSYVLPTVCPGSAGYKMVTTPQGNLFCLKAYNTNMVYSDAQAKCQENGGSLMYLGADISGNLPNLDAILDDLGTNWHSGWGGAQQEEGGSSTWLWSYGGAEMTSSEYNSFTWSVTGPLAAQKCLEFDGRDDRSVVQAPCSYDNDFICEIVLF